MKPLHTRLWDVLLLILVCYSLIHVAHSSYKYALRYSDFDFQYGFAQIYAQNHTLPQDNLFLYPLFHYSVLIPLTWFPLEKVKMGVYALNFLMAIASVVMLSRLWSKKPVGWRSWSMVLIVAANYWPMLETLNLYKVEMWELFLITLIFVAFSQGKEVLTGMLTVVAANLKYFPGIFFFYFLAKRNWKVIISILGTSVIMVSLLVTIFGFQNVIEFHEGMLSRFSTSGEIFEQQAAHTPVIFNEAPTGMILRWFADGPSMNPVIPKVRTAIRIGFIFRLFALLLFFLIFWMTSSSSPLLTRIELNLALVFIFFISPVIDNQYAVLLIPCFIFAYFYIEQHWRTLQWTDWILFPVAYILIGHFIPLGVLQLFPQTPSFPLNQYLVWWYSLPTIGYILLGIQFYTLLRKHRSVSV